MLAPVSRTARLGGPTSYAYGFRARRRSELGTSRSRTATLLNGQLRGGATARRGAPYRLGQTQCWCPQGRCLAAVEVYRTLRVANLYSQLSVSQFSAHGTARHRVEARSGRRFILPTSSLQRHPTAPQLVSGTLGSAPTAHTRVTHTLYSLINGVKYRVRIRYGSRED